MLYRMLGFAALTLGSALGAQAQELTVRTFGGAFADAQQSAYFDPFAEESGAKVWVDTDLGGLATIKSAVIAGQVKWDVVMVDEDELTLGCAEGLFEPLDLKAMGGEDLLPEAVSPCGAGSLILATGIAYNTTDMGGGSPKSWADFWDLETWPGKRGMRNAPQMNLIAALLADGVDVEDITDVMRTPEGLDRAFAKMDEIKAEIQFWEAGAQPVEWLNSGNVVMSTAYNARISNAKEEGAPLEYVWHRNMLTITAWAVPTGAPNKDLGLEFIKFANQPEPQANFSKLFLYGPTNSKAFDFLDEARASQLPAGEKMTESFSLDQEFWSDNYDRILVRWTAWAAQ